MVSFIALDPSFRPFVFFFKGSNPAHVWLSQQEITSVEMFGANFTNVLRAAFTPVVLRQ
jgi:hypothetical protein